MDTTINLFFSFSVFFFIFRSAYIIIAVFCDLRKIPHSILNRRIHHVLFFTTYAFPFAFACVSSIFEFALRSFVIAFGRRFVAVTYGVHVHSVWALNDMGSGAVASNFVWMVFLCVFRVSCEFSIFIQLDYSFCWSFFFFFDNSIIKIERYGKKMGGKKPISMFKI